LGTGLSVSIPLILRATDHVTDQSSDQGDDQRRWSSSFDSCHSGDSRDGA